MKFEAEDQEFEKMRPLDDDQRVADLTVFSARKANLSIITISQNIFQNSKFGCAKMVNQQEKKT